MNGKGGTGLIALILALTLIPFFLLLVLVMGIADEEDRENGTSCLGPGTGLGSGDRLAPTGSFIKPVDPSTVTFTSGFGPRWGTEHQGIDLAGAIGTPIYASADGVVRQAGPASGFGQWVVLDHVIDGQLVSTVYGHIETYTVAVGEQVRAGQQIATLGNRGQSTGPHLHWEIWPGGWGTAAVDPLPYYESAPAPGDTSAGPITPVPSAPPQGDLAQPLPPSAGSEQGLQVDAKKLARALHLRFGDRIASIGGWRADGGYATDHTEGRAVDAMIANYRSGDGVALGDEITDYVLANADALGVEYVIWRQTYYPVGGAPSLMDNRGSETQNHFDHVHITVRGQGTDERLVSWGSLPGGSGNATAAAADCLISGDGVGDYLADGTVPPEFAAWIERAGSICPQIRPSLLAAQLAAENGFRHGDSAPVSVTGAMGPAQFMPGTWASYGQDYDGDGRVDVNSIGDAVMAQGHYMCTIASTIDGWIDDGVVSAPNGRTELYLAGYNAGEGAVLNSGGFPTGHTDYVVQTRPYADKIIAAEPQYRAMSNQ
ncbi:M23 family metallopeptidase [Rhodococcus pyridinivorans]|uniref:M23 family metallopeptidase n=1 Tax=Rhodococcus pyridinivorans TaxID=103816 RepID=UPI002226E67B|nr:M23 family metallopeptidase [Rhodococcus pyridinivorans]MCW3471838.1 M23 family metallopeptidase [Rhodococcus pyridinivorans]